MHRGRTLALNLGRPVPLAIQGLYLQFHLFFHSFFASISQLLKTIFPLTAFSHLISLQ